MGITGIFLALHYTSDLNSAYFSLFFPLPSSWKSIILWFIFLFCKYLVFRNSSTLLLNGYSIYWLCLTFWTNEFLGSYCNYKSLISISIFSRISLWRILCSQSNIEEVLYLSISSSRFSSPSPFLPSFSIFIQSFEEFNK